MAPKKGKEGVVNENSWRRKIEEARLNEPTWNAKVVVLESAGGEQDFIYLTKFEQFSTQEKRFVIKNISRAETTFMINQLGGEKKVKDDNLRVFEEGQAYLKEKKEIPSDLLALIIKHLILKMKDEYIFIRRQKLEVKEGLRRESTTMIDRAEVRGTVIAKSPEPEPLPPTSKKGKREDFSAALPQPEEGKKYNTNLRVRGEEWRDRTYVDDYPTDGPNLYIAVTGFLDGNLPAALVKIGIPVVAIVQVRINPSIMKVPSSLMRATKRGHSQTNVTEKSLKFWDELQEIRIKTDTAHILKNTAFIIFSPPYWDTESLSGNPDKIYDEICYLMYDVQDLTRQHTHFLDNVDVYHIPEEVEDVRYKQLYHQLIDDIPLECITIYSVIDSLLQVAANKVDGAVSNSRSSLSTALTLNPAPAEDKGAEAEKLVTKLFNTLCNTEIRKKSYRTTYGKETENYKDPLVIKYGDYVKYTTFHLGNLNLHNIVRSTLLNMPLHRLWNNQDNLDGELQAKINFHVNILLSCFEREDVETAELNRLIHILSCRKLFNNRSSLKKQHLPPSTINQFKKTFLKRSAIAEPLSKCPSDFQNIGNTSPSFPSMTKSEDISEVSQTEDAESRRLKFLFDCPDISELVTATEIANNKPVSHIIDDFEFFEDLGGIRAFQVLLDAFNKFNCVDYKYCEISDCFVLMFFNSHDKQNIARDEWRCHLPTPLCLQDYFDFILDEQYNWIQNEEKIYDEAMAVKEQSQSQVNFDPFAATSCIENMDVEMELLMEGSFKYKDIIVPEQSENELSNKSTTTKKNSASDVNSKSSVKTKSPATSTPKKYRRSLIVPHHDSEHSVNMSVKPFFGYDLSDRRVEVFGKDASYFAQDGTRVTAMYTLMIPTNVEYIGLNVLPGNSANEFWMHRALVEYVAPEIVDICESFRIICKDNLAIYIKKQSYQVPYPVVTSTSSVQTKAKETSKTSIGSSPQSIDKSPFYSFYITWPNGLITESVHEENSSNISHIKQHFTVPVLDIDEVMRCISLKGEVIIFKKSGDIEVLRPDASYIRITHCEKIIVPPEIPEDRTDTSSDKGKKTKDKSKEKSKQGSSAKSSKNAANEEDKTTEPKIEYKLYINEYESVDANGYRQKWINDFPHFIENLLIRTATDHCTGEVFSRRVGGCNLLISRDGSQIVTFPDNTRIITFYVIEYDEIYPEWTDEEKEYFDMIDSELLETDSMKLKGSQTSQKSFGDRSEASLISKKIEEEESKERTDGYISVHIIYTIENGHFATLSIDKAAEKIIIESPNSTSVTVNLNNTFEFSLDNATNATFDGTKLHINYEACPKCRSQTNCDVIVRRDESSSASKIHQYWLKLKDSFCKWISVNEEGDIDLIDQPCSQEVIPGDENYRIDENAETEDKTDRKSESSITSHSKCREIYQAKAARFFVLKRDLKCSEIIHRALIDEYMNQCRWLPWCSTNNYQAFADYRTLHSMLTPISITETEKWLMETKLNKPSYLTYQHLKRDCGKGFYHWMRPYERFDPKPIQPEAVLPPRLPNAFILRTLEQQWDDKRRDRLSGAKELSQAILRYRRVMAEDLEAILHVPVVDHRSESEQRVEEAVQDLAHALYEDLKKDLHKALEKKAKLTVTTMPLPPEPSVAFVHGEEDSLDFSEMYKELEEDRTHAVKQLERAEEMSPALKKYWRRRAADLGEEKFYQYLLRDGSVPPYFKNILGGAIWWDLQHMAGEGVSKVERRNMKCVCADQDSCSHRALTPDDYF